MYPLRNKLESKKFHPAEQLKSHQRNERIHYVPRKMVRLPGATYPKSAGSVAPGACLFMCSESRTSILCWKRWTVNRCHRRLWPLPTAEKRRGRVCAPGSALGSVKQPLSVCLFRLESVPSSIRDIAAAFPPIGS